jgi:hypothetical protein
VTPAIEDAFAARRAQDVAILIECMDRKRRFGSALDAIECDEMGNLLGSRPSTREEGDSALCTAIRAHRIEDEPLVQYLARRAYRDEWLYAPAAGIYPDRGWSELD